MHLKKIKRYGITQKRGFFGGSNLLRVRFARPYDSKTDRVAMWRPSDTGRRIFIDSRKKVICLRVFRFWA